MKGHWGLALLLLGTGGFTGSAAGQALLDQTTLRSPWAKACAGMPDDTPLPVDPRTLVVPGVNTNPNAALQLNGYWVDLHTPPAPFVSGETPNPTTCGEFRESRDQGWWNIQRRQYFLPIVSPEGYNAIWSTRWHLTERPANLDQQMADRYGLHPAPFRNPYPRCDVSVVLGAPVVSNCEDPNAPGIDGGSGQLPLGLMQGRGLCEGGLLNGTPCDYGSLAETGLCESAGGYCSDKWNKHIGPSCSFCHDSQFLKNGSGADLFSWGRSADSSDMGLCTADTFLSMDILGTLVQVAPFPWSAGRGATDAIGILDVEPALFDPDSLAVAPSILEFFPSNAAGQVKAPNWWYRAFKTRQFADGGLSSDNVRSEMAFGIANIYRNAEERRVLTHEFEDIDNFLISLSPPAYPYAVTTTLAETGAKLFHERDLWSSNGRLCTGGNNVGKFCTTNADCPSSSCGTGSAASTWTCDRGSLEGKPCTSDAECGAGNKCSFGSSPQSPDVCDAGPRTGASCASDGDCGFKCNGTHAYSFPFDYTGARAGQACGTSSDGSNDNWCNPKICWGGSKAGQICEGQSFGWCGFMVACDRDYGGTDMSYPKCDAPANRCVNGTIPKPAGNGSCASCHGVYSPLYAANTNYLPDPRLKGVAGVITPIETIQTNPQRYLLMSDVKKRRSWDTSFLAYNEQHPDAIGFPNLIESEINRVPRAAYDWGTGPIFSPEGPNKWRTPTGYVAQPLYGAWAAAPYLHNGSVPNMESLLAPWLRPKVWARTTTAGFTANKWTLWPFYQQATGLNRTYQRRMNANNANDTTNDYDWSKLGWKYTTLSCSNDDANDPYIPCDEYHSTEDQTFTEVPTVTQLTNWIALAMGNYSSLFYQSPPPITDKQIKSRLINNTNLFSLSNGGHVFTQSLTAAERAAILEYMKTL